jgi:hypothetical protein
LGVLELLVPATICICKAQVVSVASVLDIKGARLCKLTLDCLRSLIKEPDLGVELIWSLHQNIGPNYIHVPLLATLGDDVERSFNVKAVLFV